MKFQTFFTLLLLVLLPAARALAQAPVMMAKAPAILFANENHPPGYDFVARLQDAGFAVNSLKSLEELTWDKAKNYNVLVLTGLGNAGPGNALSELNRANLQVVQRFLAAGGGVFYVPMSSQQSVFLPPQQAFAASVGLTPLFDDAPTDATLSKNATAFDIPFAPTREIAPSPITQGVQNLWYPAPLIRYGGQSHTVPLQTDETWKIVVKGSPTSSLLKVGANGVAAVPDEARPGPVSLVATREVGAGRVVSFGIVSNYWMNFPSASTLGNIVGEAGLDGQRSDGFRLILNAFQWLAAPSLQSGALGGAKMDEALLKNPVKTTFGPAFDWSKVVGFPAELGAYPGVIGARSDLSSGKASPETWVKAAQAQGLSYLVFLEEFSELSPEKLEKLKAECRRLSTPNFSAVPGFTIDDEIGNHYFYISDNLLYPPKELLSADGKVFVSHDAQVSPKDPNIKGQINMTLLNYTYEKSGFNITAGNYLFTQDASPFADYFGLYSAVGVVTARGGKPIEDSTGGFLQTADSGQGALPLALDLMDDPAQLGTSNWRTVLKLKPNEAAKMSSFWNTWHFYPSYPNNIYITQGPQIASWSFVGTRDYGSDNRGDFVWQSLRWQVQGKVNSDVGLREVAVYDGPTLFRRFLPAGRKEFEFTLDLTHDQQHNFVLIATDTQGKRAISREMWDRNHKLQETMCSDRDNQLSFGYCTNSQGLGILIGGNEAFSTPVKRLDDRQVGPAGIFRNDKILGASAFDGGAGGDPIAATPLEMRADGKVFAPPSVVESKRLLHSADISIGQGEWAHNFTDDVKIYNVWHTLWKTEPARDFTVTQRNHFFQLDPDSPLAVLWWKMKVDVLRDLPDTSLRVASLSSGKDLRYVVRGNDGKTVAAPWNDKDSAPLKTAFGPNAYGAFLDSPLGSAAVFPLTEGLEATLQRPGRNNLEITLPAAATPHKKGESKEIEMLVVGVPRPGETSRALGDDSAATVERFARDFGLTGEKPRYELKIDAGKMISQRYILRVDGAATQGFSGQIQGDLVSTLPIAVSGLHTNWSAFLYDRALQSARPLGVLENQTWATVPVSGQQNLFVGHPIIADNADIMIQVTQTGADAWRVELHNSTDQPLNVSATANRFFDPFAGRAFPAGKLNLAAGSSMWLDSDAAGAAFKIVSKGSDFRASKDG